MKSRRIELARIVTCGMLLFGSIGAGTALYGDVASITEQAFGRACGFLEMLGFDVDSIPRPQTVFQDRIILEGKHVPDAFGLFEPSTKTVYAVGLSSAKFQAGGFLGQPASEELYISLLTHEYVHYLNNHIYPDLPVVVDELIAATGQLLTMDRDARSRVYETVNPMHIASLNSIVLGDYWANPVGFLCGCARYGEAHVELLARCLQGRGPRLKDPLFVDPEMG